MMLQIGAFLISTDNDDDNGSSDSSGNTTNVGGEQECHHEEEGEDDQIISSFQRIALTFSTHYSKYLYLHIQYLNLRRIRILYGVYY